MRPTFDPWHRYVRWFFISRSDRWVFNEYSCSFPQEDHRNLSSCAIETNNLLYIFQSLYNSKLLWFILNKNSRHTLSYIIVGNTEVSWKPKSAGLQLTTISSWPLYCPLHNVFYMLIFLTFSCNVWLSSRSTRPVDVRVHCSSSDPHLPDPPFIW